MVANLKRREEALLIDMANYFVIGNNFKPFTYDEMVKPLVAYKEAYDAEQDRLEKIMDNAAAMQQLSKELEPDLYNSFQNWQSQLRGAGDNLSNKGLTPQTADAIKQLNNLYKTEFSPLSENLKAREALIKEQREYMQKHPNAFFNVDYSTVPVTEVTPASTYIPYDPDETLSAVYKDAYSKAASGEEIPTADAYLDKVGQGITDKNHRDKLMDAINTGISAAKAQKKKEDDERYLKELQIRASRARSSSSSSSSGRGYLEDGFVVGLHDGTSLFVNYDKKLGVFKFKDRNKQDQSISRDEFNALYSRGAEWVDDAVRNKYYAGQYGTIDIGRSHIPRVITTEKQYDPADKMEHDVVTGLSVYSPAKKSWVPIYNLDNATLRDIYTTYTGQSVSLIPQSDLSASAARGKTIDEIDEVAVNKSEATKRSKFTKEDAKIEDYKGSSNKGLADLANKVEDLRQAGLLTGYTLTIYRDKDGDYAGYKFEPDYAIKNLDAPIELGDPEFN